ncbi:MAG TPA: TetR/AcrR family transcriptional regulator [Acidimicrobiales bacterium]|nr:TetR/AcrR family transcriptional regulator [Acidimicrobiales bacterium]
MTPVRRDSETAARILDVAERLVQERGFNGFSYADVSAELNITKAALHYHFPGKAELGVALMTRYAARFADALADVESRVVDAPNRLDSYADLYLDVLRKERMCLCGMLAAEYQTLPPPMRDTVLRFFDQNETWLTRVLEQGRTDGDLQFAGPPRDTARMIVGALEGALLVARPFGDVTRFQVAAGQLLESLRRVPPEPV